MAIKRKRKRRPKPPLLHVTLKRVADADVQRRGALQICARRPKNKASRVCCMPGDGWRLRPEDENALIALWPFAKVGEGSMHIAADLTHLVRVHIDRLQSWASREDYKKFKRHFMLVLDDNRGRHRKPSTLVDGVVSRLAGQRTVMVASKTGNSAAPLFETCINEINSSERITPQMRVEAAVCWLLGGGGPSRQWLEGHHAHTPFRLMASELLNRVAERVKPAMRTKRVAVSKYWRGRSADSALVYSPVVHLAHEIDRIAFDYLRQQVVAVDPSDATKMKRTAQLRRALERGRMGPADLSQCYDRMIKVRRQMLSNERNGHTFNVLGHHFAADEISAISTEAERILAEIAATIVELRLKRARSLMAKHG